MLKALRGKTVVVTRPRLQAAALCAALEREGASVVAAPLIRVAGLPSYAKLDAALRRLRDYDAAAFTSGNAVDAFFERLKRLKLGRPGRPAGLYAVGPSTARALAAAGWKGAAVPKKHDSAALAKRMGKVKGLRILLPRALRAREELPRLLRAKGAQVNAVACYRTVEDKAGGRRLSRAAGRGIDAVAFTSGSTVKQFVRRLSLPVSRRLLGRAAAASIGPVTSAALRAYGLDPAVQAEHATDKGLCRALVGHFSRQL